MISKLPITRVADDADLAAGLPPLHVDDTGTVTTRMGRGALTVELTTPAGVALTLTLTTIHLKSKLVSYPNGRFQPRNEAERARFAAYALFQRAAEAATVRSLMDRLLPSAPLPSITNAPTPITAAPFSDHAMVVATLDV